MDWPSLETLPRSDETGVRTNGGRLIVKAVQKPRCKLAERLAGSDHALPLTSEEQDWVNGVSRGQEII